MVGFDLHPVVDIGALDGHEQPVLPGDDRRLFFIVPEEDDAGVAGHPVVFLPEAVGPHVAVEDVDVGIGISLLDGQGVLHRHGAADAAAVGTLVVAGAGALDHDDVLGAAVEAVLMEPLFQFALGQDIFRLAVEESGGFGRLRPGGRR